MNIFEIELRIEEIKNINKNHFHDNENYDNNNFENKSLKLLNKNKPFINNIINKKIKEVLGNEFKLEDLKFKKGSIEVLIVIGTVYHAISNYKDFIEGVNLIISHIETVFFTIFGIQDTPVKINSQIKTNIKTPIYYKHPFNSKIRNFRPSMILIIYLIVTNIIMLVGYIFLIYGVVLKII